VAYDKRVYIDFKDGAGFIEVSHLVKYDTLNISRNAFNDQYKTAQSECSFDIIFDYSIYSKITSFTKDIALRITQTVGEDENPLFYGHIPYDRSWAYNGILENTIISLSAIDDIDYLDVPVGDVSYTGYAVCDPANPSTSLLHALLTAAGWDMDMVDDTVTITHTIAKFAPDAEDEHVLSILNELLYEYGYTLSIDVSGKVHPVRWNLPSGSTTSFEFNESNIVDEVQIKDKVQIKDGVKITHYNLGFKEDILVYRDEKCGYDDKGAFSGVSIPAGYYYPLTANVIDETTGVNQIVWQEYTDDSIEYFTNKAIAQGLDYNYKAFESDFTGIIATENHVHEYRTESGVVRTIATFLNKKAQILFHNPTLAPKFIYYNNIYADVWYKTDERIVEVYPTDSLKKDVYEDTLKYVFTKERADEFAQGIAKQFEVGNISYKFTSEIYRPEGTFVRVKLDNGIDSNAIIQKVSVDETTGLYEYQCVVTSLTRTAITSQRMNMAIAINKESPYVLEASATNLTVPYDSTTKDYDYSTVAVALKVTRGGVDYTADWSYAISASGVTYNLVDNILAITDVAGASGTLMVIASRTGRPSQTIQIDVTRAQISEAISDIVGGDTTTPPNNITNLTAIAKQEVINVSWLFTGEGTANAIDHYNAWVSKDDGSSWTPLANVNTNSLIYEFNRDTDGYPEIADLADWKFRIQAVNIYDITSVASPEAYVNTDQYNTWLPRVPSLNTRVNGRGLSLGWGFASDWYGMGPVDIQIAKGYTVVSGEVVLITNPASLVAYAPAVGVDPAANYENYKEGEIDGYLSRDGSTFFIALPLYGQNETDPISRDTPYYVRVRGSTKVPTTLSPSARLASDWTDWTLVYAHATSAQDVVRAWTLDDNGEKVKVDGALGAHQLYAEFLAAISANLGVITDGAMVGNENNLWALSRIMEDDGVTTRYYEGTVRMGGEDQYLHINPITQNGVVIGYNIDFRVGNFTVTAVGSIVNGKFEVRNLRGDRVYFTVDPENKGLVTVEKQLKVGPYTTAPSDGINVQESYGTSALAFTGTGVNDMEIVEEGTVDGDFEVEITDAGDCSALTIQQDLLDGSQIRCIVRGSDYIILGTNFTDAWRSLDNGASWTSVAQYTGVDPTLRAAINGDTVVYAERNYIYVSHTRGSNPTLVDHNGYVIAHNAVVAYCNDFYFVAQYNLDSGIQFRISIDGDIWNYANVSYQPPTSCTNFINNFIIPIDTYLLINIGCKLWKFTRESYSNFSAVLLYDFGVGEATYASVHMSRGNNYLLAVTTSGKVYKSTDDGVTWVLKQSLNIPATCISLDNDKALIGSALNNTSGTIYISTDDGETWALSVSLASDPVYSISAGSDFTLVGCLGKVYKSYAQARWRETSGAWSDPFAIGPTYSTELTGYGITIGFAAIAGHVLGDTWAFTQGPIGALSARTRAGVEYFALREGLVKNPSILVTDGTYTIPDCDVGSIVKYIKTNAYDGNGGAVILPPAGVILDKSTSVTLHGSYSYVILERINNTVFVVADIRDEYQYNEHIRIIQAKETVEYLISDTVTLASGLNTYNYTVPDSFYIGKSFMTVTVTDPSTHWTFVVRGGSLFNSSSKDNVRAIIQNDGASQTVTLNIQCRTCANYLILDTLITDTGDTVITDSGDSISLITINLT
jgi:photosystem II stability/assembly factor-like uncharacterized protein